MVRSISAVWVDFDCLFRFLNLGQASEEQGLVHSGKTHHSLRDREDLFAPLRRTDPLVLLDFGMMSRPYLCGSKDHGSVVCLRVDVHLATRVSRCVMR